MSGTPFGFCYTSYLSSPMHLLDIRAWFHLNSQFAPMAFELMKSPKQSYTLQRVDALTLFIAISNHFHVRIGVTMCKREVTELPILACAGCMLI
jgi:hypothetical protein